MIEHIRAEGFKGFKKIDEDVPQKGVYLGKNTSGKSARAGIIAIAIYGYIPFSTSGKLPGDILSSYGNGSLICAVTIGGVEFARKFYVNSKGGASQAMQIDRKKASKTEFAVALEKAGGPKIADTAEFTKQSETKKIDTLFDLFPNPELSSIDLEINNAKAYVSKWEKKVKGAESTIQHLSKSKIGYEVPAGSIAEIQSEIKSIDSQIADLQDQIKAAEIEEAKEAAKVEAKEEVRQEIAEEKTQMMSHEEDNIIPPPNVTPSSDYFHASQDLQDGNLRSIAENGGFVQINQATAANSIQRIIEALKGAGCGTCAALIIAKQELKKYV